MSYTEIQLDRRVNKRPDFPLTCPECGEEVIARSGPSVWPEFSAVMYGCGGAYKHKPQIQNHTNKWWGSCGKERKKRAYAVWDLLERALKSGTLSGPLAAEIEAHLKGGE